MNNPVISKLSPPSDKCRIEITYQRRDGTQIEYRVGGGLTDHAMARECGGCLFCLGQVSFSNVTRAYNTHSFGSSRPKFYRWPCEPCEKCAPILNRLDEIDAQIFTLNQEKKRLS